MTTVKLSRREVLRRGTKGALAAGFVYTFGRGQSLDLTRVRFPIENLSPRLAGMKIAFASDFHHSRQVPRETIRRAVDMINRLSPDVVLLGGDYVTRARSFYGGAFEELARLEAPRGVYSVAGNHDYSSGIAAYRSCISRCGITDMTNRGADIGLPGAPLWLAGLDDYWHGWPDGGLAVAGAPAGAPRIAFTHNAEAADELPPGYADLIISGHTHGWQIYIPVLTRFFVPTERMRKYRAGFYRTPAGMVYITKGVGTIRVPIRVWCRPEIALFELVPATAQG